MNHSLGQQHTPSGITHTPVPELDDVAHLLRPVIRRAGFGDESVHKRRRIIAGLGLDIGDYTPISLPLVSPLIDRYVMIDLPGAHGYVFPELLGSYVVPALLRHWGITAEQAFAAAYRNMEGATGAALDDRPAGTGKPELLDLSGEPGDFAASLPMLEGWYEQVCDILGPDTLVFMPAEGTLVLGLGMKGRGTLLWEEIERRYESAARPLSPLPYVCDRGRLVPYQAGFEAPEFAALERASARFTATCYQQQAERLRALRADGDDNWLVADVIAGARTDGTALTVASWVDGDATLMPIVDQVVVIDPDGDFSRNIGVPLELVIGIVQPKPVPGLHPPRYLLPDHPDAATMERLRRVATMH
ncbi:hypothetical protein ACWIGI_32280 [Nocardia sp. NPDC055321]